MRQVSTFVASMLASVEAVGTDKSEEASRISYSSQGSWDEACNAKNASPFKISDDDTSPFAAPGGYQLRGKAFGQLRGAERTVNDWTGANKLALQNNGFIGLHVDQVNPKTGVSEKVKKQFVPFKLDFKMPSEHWVADSNSKEEKPEVKQHDLEI